MVALLGGLSRARRQCGDVLPGDVGDVGENDGEDGEVELGEVGEYFGDVGE